MVLIERECFENIGNVVIRSIFANVCPHLLRIARLAPILYQIEQVHKKYDLKGSTVDRDASEKEKLKKEPTLKDNDFVKDGVKIIIGEEAKGKLMETINADVDFLAKHDIMDYSLLLGIHDTRLVRKHSSKHLLILLPRLTRRTGRRRTPRRRMMSTTVGAPGWP